MPAFTILALALALSCPPAEPAVAFVGVNVVPMSSETVLAKQVGPTILALREERRVGVMVRGRWLEQAELRGQLDELATRFATADDAATQAATDAESDVAKEPASDAGTGAAPHAADETSPRQ